MLISLIRGNELHDFVVRWISHVKAVSNPISHTPTIPFSVSDIIYIPRQNECRNQKDRENSFDLSHCPFHNYTRHLNSAVLTIKEL